MTVAVVCESSQIARIHSPDALNKEIGGRLLEDNSTGKNGQPFAFHYALPVDSSGVLLDGRCYVLDLPVGRGRRF